ncbi:MAG: SigB/SigF/SigG family RNA polymerase sigma factor [Eubacteriales bacterium]|nr:SigB/SigF/SigG family RNA polymerase sigma factor [Eubacteriales bacterium]MDD3199999.1 SigB/SigF/SigG family RNA polymerase sigma factor [Eubacteriales bacterium]MDD4121269.1 SigB/SigF/SigG family RNA polymerase sigma factor [Eubacteriales bacterium]MDD4629978.1 SigB/SigF/SigG family RNA polymerase sigma factor [Eubacteriales bacterium]
MTSSETGNKDLFERYHETGNIELRNELVEKYLYIVDILIRKYLNKGVDYEDLYQVGSMALVFAVERYDVSKGFEFTSFATPTIIGEIKRYFRDKGWAIKVPRRLKEISAQITPAKETLYAKYNRIPTIKELSEYLGYTEEEILEAMEGGQAYSTYSLNQTFDEGGEDGAVLEKYTGRDEPGYSSFENAELIKTVMEDMSEQERDIFKRRYLDNETQQMIASDMGVSQMTISRLEKKIRDKFKTAVK